MLLQKYGVTAPRIDRQVTRPKWMGVAEWKRKMNDWYKSTKGMVPQTPPSRTFRPRVILDKDGKPLARTFQPRKGNPAYTSRFGLHPQDTRAFPRNSGQTRTGNRPS